MRDLAPEIHRQRLVIEGYPVAPIQAVQIQDYLAKTSEVLGMTVLRDPVTNHSARYGWAGWIHWETSGAHFYAWDEPALFFSVDIYACKPFDAFAAVEFTREFFGITDPAAIEFREF